MEYRLTSGLFKNISKPYLKIIIKVGETIPTEPREPHASGLYLECLIVQQERPRRPVFGSDKIAGSSIPYHHFVNSLMTTQRTPKKHYRIFTYVTGCEMK